MNKKERVLTAINLKGVYRIPTLWGNRGGIILAHSHETLPDTPIENILAIYETINEV